MCVCVGPSESLVPIKVTEAVSAEAPGPGSNSEERGVVILLIFTRKGLLHPKARVNPIQDPRCV